MWQTSKIYKIFWHKYKIVCDIQVQHSKCIVCKSGHDKRPDLSVCIHTLRRYVMMTAAKKGAGTFLIVDEAIT